MTRLRSLLVCVLLCSLSACNLDPHAIDHVPEAAPIRNHQVLINNIGWHTGFVIEAERLNTALPFLTDRFTPSTLYYELGWGDKGFYQSHEITTELTLRAMLWSSGSVVHVVAVPESPYQYFSNNQLVAVPLSESEFNDLIRFIASSFARDANGRPIRLQSGLYGDSQFYAGNGSYSLVNTCNKWTARGLKSAGLDISTPFKLTAGSIMDYLQSQAPQETVK